MVLIDQLGKSGEAASWSSLIDKYKHKKLVLTLIVKYFSCDRLLDQRRFTPIGSDWVSGSGQKLNNTIQTMDRVGAGVGVVVVVYVSVGVDVKVDV